MSKAYLAPPSVALRIAPVSPTSQTVLGAWKEMLRQRIVPVRLFCTSHDGSGGGPGGGLKGGGFNTIVEVGGSVTGGSGTVGVDDGGSFVGDGVVLDPPLPGVLPDVLPDPLDFGPRINFHCKKERNLRKI